MRLKKITFRIETYATINKPKLVLLLNGEYRTGFSYGEEYGIAFYKRSKMYSITHINSGYSLLYCSSRIKAIKVMKELIKSELDFSKDKEYLINNKDIFSKIRKDLGDLILFNWEKQKWKKD